MSKEQIIRELMEKVHRKVEADPELKKELMPIKKTLNLDLGEEVYSVRLENAEMTDFITELRDDADITVITTPENFQALVDGTLKPMKAYLLKKIKIKGKLDDLMKLKKFL